MHHTIIRLTSKMFPVIFSMYVVVWRQWHLRTLMCNGVLLVWKCRPRSWSQQPG